MTNPNRTSLIADLSQAWSAYMDAANETDEQRKWQEAFFGVVRDEFGSLTIQGVEGIKTMIFCHRQFWSDSPIEYLACFLGNARQEVGPNMQPIKETQGSDEIAISDQQVVARLNNWWASGKAKKAKVRSKYWLATAGYPFGRGLIQTTHHDNYAKTRAAVLKVTGVDIPFDEDYSLMLDPLASAIGGFAMCLIGGFRGHYLEQFIRVGIGYDYKGARNIVNGDTHNYGRVARFCKSFEKALKAAEEAAPGWLSNQQAENDISPTQPPASLPETEISISANSKSGLDRQLQEIAQSAKANDIAVSLQVHLDLQLPESNPQPFFKAKQKTKERNFMTNTKSPFQSKINITSAVAAAAALGTVFGIDIEPETQAKAAATITAVSGALNIVFRTWFTTKTLR